MSNNEGSNGVGYARDNNLENIFTSTDKTKHHKQAPENIVSIIIVSYYVLQSFCQATLKDR